MRETGTARGTDAASTPWSPPRLGALFLKFLRFGALAWGGPVAQIAMLREELVERERWIEPARFNRVLAVYQAMPGPEAHELCVYFGMRARGRIGGVLAGLAFMLPGFILMCVLSWVYVRYGIGLGQAAPILAAVQVAVAALIVRSVVRIGRHAIADRAAWVVASLAASSQLVGVHFAAVLAASGLLVLALRSGRIAAAWCVGVAWLLCLIALAASRRGLSGLDALSLATPTGAHALEAASVLALFWSGLKAGLLTFGGAYTAIPFVQRDAVVEGGWLSNAQFLDGLALSGLLPAPMVIFATFVGYVAGGPGGALAMTAGMFLPAFALTLVGHDVLERLLERPRLRWFLDGVTAGVVGLIAATTLALLRVAVDGVPAAVLFACALALFFVARNRLAVPAILLACAAWGWLSSA